MPAVATASPFDDDLPVSSSGAEIDLSQFDEEWGETEAAKFNEIPDGKYQVRIDKAELVLSHNGNPMIKFDLIVMSGEHEGRHIFKNSVISSVSLPYVKGDLAKLGLELDRLSALPGHLRGILDMELEITKRTRDDHVNVFFNRRIEVDHSGAAF